ncbi:MAG: GNAT family N-acetyltransferase [Solirubrobacterales bacterium]
MIWPPPREPLEGSIVRLEALEPGHEAALAEAAADAEIWTWMDRTIASEPGAFDRWFSERLEASRAGQEWCFATLSASTGAAIGSSSYLAIRAEHDGLEIGWTWLAPAAWRSGANLEAKLLMLRLAFEGLGCMRVEFKTDARNQRSRAALEALPATFEGIFRKHMLMRGIGVRDSAYFSITDEEWPDVRANLEARLSAHDRSPSGAL